MASPRAPLTAAEERGSSVRSKSSRLPDQGGGGLVRALTCDGILIPADAGRAGRDEGGEADQDRAPAECPRPGSLGLGTLPLFLGDLPLRLGPLPLLLCRPRLDLGPLVRLLGHLARDVELALVLGRAGGFIGLLGSTLGIVRGLDVVQQIVGPDVARLVAQSSAPLPAAGRAGIEQVGTCGRG